MAQPPQVSMPRMFQPARTARGYRTGQVYGMQLQNQQGKAREVLRQHAGKSTPPSIRRGGGQPSSTKQFMSILKWTKAYQGPFEKAEAQIIASELRAGSRPDINGIYDARVRARRGGKGYDVYIQEVRQ